MADPLIRTKLRLPFTRANLVPRPRLQEQIAQGLRGPMTLITAPAGFGKTTLVASCVTQLDRPTAWLALDKNDNHARRFLRYLVAALQQADSRIGSEAAQLTNASPQPSHQAILTLLINELDALNNPITLVLDDYQFINSQEIHDSLAFLLDHCPQTFHLIIVSRSDPPLPLARLRARGQLVELRAADLRFTASEAGQFLNNVMALDLDAQAIATLEERTEGWITGLHMAALSLRHRQDTVEFVAGFSGTNRYILDYLLEEVLSSQSPEITQFLLRTSVLTRLSPNLCDAVLANDVDSTPILDYLEKANLFLIPLDDHRHWYRYHHLFADLLQARLHQAEPVQVPQILSRAAQWCEDNGQVSEAVGYSLAAPNYAQTTNLITKHWQQLMNAGEIETVWSWLQALPDDEIKNSAQLSTAYCWALWFSGKIGDIETHLAHAELALDNSGEHRELAAGLAALRSFMARHDGDFETAVSHAQRALKLAPTQLSPQADAQLQSMIFLALATAYDGAGSLEEAVQAYQETIRLSRLSASAAGITGITYRLIGILRLLGRLREADTTCRETLAYVQEQGMARLPAAGILHLAMSEVLIEQNDLSAAESHITQGVELGKWSGRLDAARNAAPALSRLRLAHGDVKGALAAIAEAEAALGSQSSPLAKAELLALKAKILVRQNALDEAKSCVAQAIQLAGQDKGQTGELVALASANVHAQANPKEAVPQLEQTLITAEAQNRLGTALELRLLLCQAHNQQGNTLQVGANLERALFLAKQEGYVRVFLDAGQAMHKLLAQTAVNTSQEYVQWLLSQFDAETPVNQAAADTLLEPLSPREIEVLTLIAAGCTNQEVAAQLVVSPGTVKAHTSNIYRKLDVANRTEAVTRARQLGIFN